MYSEFYSHCNAHCHVWEWLQTGFELIIGFIKYLLVITTSNYSAIANSHTLEFTTARINYFSLLCLHQSLSCSGFQLRSFLPSVFVPLTDGDSPN
jgi:hypothetical protein